MSRRILVSPNEGPFVVLRHSDLQWLIAHIDERDMNGHQRLRLREALSQRNQAPFMVSLPPPVDPTIDEELTYLEQAMDELLLEDDPAKMKLGVEHHHRMQKIKKRIDEEGRRPEHVTRLMALATRTMVEIFGFEPSEVEEIINR